MNRQAYSHAYAAGTAIMTARAAIATGDDRGADAALEEAHRLIAVARAELGVMASGAAGPEAGGQTR